jgi:hypothetical protein
MNVVAGTLLSLLAALVIAGTIRLIFRFGVASGKRISV